MDSRDINVIALVKGSERYVFLFDDDSRAEALRTLGRHAANPDLSFSWYDAAVLGQKVRRSNARPRRFGFVSALPPWLVATIMAPRKRVGTDAGIFSRLPGNLSAPAPACGAV